MPIELLAAVFYTTLGSFTFTIATILFLGMQARVQRRGAPESARALTFIVAVATTVLCFLSALNSILNSGL